MAITNLRNKRIYIVYTWLEGLAGADPCFLAVFQPDGQYIQDNLLHYWYASLPTVYLIIIKIEYHSKTNPGIKKAS